MKKYIIIVLAALGLELSAQPEGTDYGVEHAVRVIYDTYGDRVRVKPKTLLKFGINTDVSTALETIWNVGGDETYPADNLITHASSSSAADTTQTVVIEGHTISGSTITFSTQNLSLNGQTSVALSTPLYRCTRLYNNSGDNFNGDIYTYRAGTTVTAGVPQEADSIHIKASSAYNQSLKCSTTISSVDYWIITGANFSVSRSGGQSRTVEFRIEVRLQDKVFRTIDVLEGSNTAGNVSVVYDPPIIIPSGADFRVRAISSGTATEVSASVNGYLATTR